MANFLYQFQMDSRLLYEATRWKKDRVQWIPVTESSWMYCGVQSDLDMPLISQHAENFFTTKKLYVVLERRDSFETTKAEVLNEIEKRQGEEDFIVWDTNFEKVIEFNKIGVFRKGSYRLQDHR